MWHMNNGHFWGMHWFWWIIWCMIIIWIFIAPSDILGQRTKKENPLDIAKRRYASGEISMEEFEEIKQKLTNK